MEISGLDSYPDLKASFVEIDKKFLELSRKRLNKESKSNQKILDSVNKGYFQLRKDLLILAGTIFGSSVALAAGRSVNMYFIFGEFFLLVSIVSGLIMLLTYLQGEEWNYAFSSKNSLESYLLMNKDKIEKFELDSTQSLADDYKKIMESSQNGFLWFLLKRITIEKWPIIFNISFLIGIILILFSIIPALTKNIDNKSMPKASQLSPIPTDYYYVPIH